MQTPAEILKQSTATDHAGTEKALIKYVKNITTAADYANLLYCLYGYYQPLEKHFDLHLAETIPQYAERRKSERVLNDIATLGYPASPQLAGHLPTITDEVSALGCFYVLEGSVLGGAVLKKMISGKCPDLPEAAFSFLSGYTNTMELWRAFLAHLNSQLHNEQSLQTAVKAANECFSLFGEWIEEYYCSLPLRTRE